jgi:hypothetical protein
MRRVWAFLLELGGKMDVRGKRVEKAVVRLGLGKGQAHCARADTMEASGFCMTLATGGGLGVSPRATVGKDDEHERWDSAWLQC